MISPEVIKQVNSIRQSAQGCTYETAYHKLCRALDMIMGAVEQEHFDLQEKK
ncbi:hypothetical protein PQC38_gp057 [Aeromonas phage BUCT695]|uniref:hypothetical protein n=1 Tax=Aeromonas phage BUCT695 TaxID=2908630 RepID=UPI0023299713|nr:hypothetical protein PQC38_gp057 [Aeromonas phage BUCT695]UIW10533.1 hypothetical protein [Aeromonas phage BUCT695]